MALVLHRKDGESIQIGDDIVITFWLKGSKVRLRIEAPKEVNIVRTELLEGTKDDRRNH